ncbi:hypothetical protein V2A60_010159 [Cordyceps javanica]|uniref:Uncharacterized protein n=1 Tax=Cordyceps javanica TaxID=43265 RepID=A0A545VU37_9HYPO|nr:hypothetical protein IF1G_08013 [Cordyceps javanica]TQW05219.1 hypothetical protein IF2G_07156 [Cordyceps javanica]
MRASVMVTCLAVAATATPTRPRIIKGWRDDDGSVSGFDAADSQNLVGQAVFSAVHAVADPTDGDAVTWKCGDKPPLGSEVECSEDAHGTRFFENLNLNSLYSCIKSAVLFCTVWIALALLFEVDKAPHTRDASLIEAGMPPADAKTGDLI